MDESTLAQAFSKRLIAAREAKGLTQVQLGEKLGVSQQTVAEWEAGRGFPRPARRDRLAEILGIEIGLPPRYAGFVAASARENREETKQLRLSGIAEAQKEGTPRDGRHRSPASAMEAAFREALPEDLRQYCEASLPFGPNRFLADYMSDKVVAELKMSSMMLTERLYASLWQLVTLAKLINNRRFVLIVIPLNQGRGTIHQRIQAEAWLHGIEIHVADSPERAAQIIVDLEEGRDPTEPGDDLSDTPSE
ncbi:MAG: helix-turn-helix domain-containing protein [Thauera sp.]